MPGKRIAYFDNLKGVLIILVVIGHLASPIGTAKNLPASALVDFIFLFHMPLFLFVSGLFCKSVLRNGRFKAENVVFYLAVSLLMYTGLIVEQLAWGADVSFNPFSLEDGRIAWYLMLLAIYSLLIPFFSRIKPWISLCVAVALAVLSGFYKLGDYFAVSRFFVFLPFFLAGYYLPTMKIVEVLDGLAAKRRLLPVRAIAILVLGGFLVAFFLLSVHNLDVLKDLFKGNISYARFADGKGPATTVCALLRIAYYPAVVLVSVAVMVLVPRRPLGLLTRTGSHSLQVYILHAFVYFALNNWSVGRNLFKVMPDAAATAMPFIVGIVLALILGYPNCFQTALDFLRRCCSKVTVASADVQNLAHCAVRSKSGGAGTAKKRLDYFDNIKGVLIVLVVLGNVLAPAAGGNGLLSTFIDVIFIFHIPLFIFVSGLFCKSAFRAGVFRSDTVIFFLALCMVMYCGLRLEVVFCFGGEAKFDPFSLGGGSVPWYLMLMAFSVACVPLLSRLRVGVVVPVVIAGSLVAGYFKLGDTLNFAHVMNYLPFFAAGYFLEPARIIEKISSLQEKRILWAVRVAAVVVLVVSFVVIYAGGHDVWVYAKELFQARTSYAQMADKVGIETAFWAGPLIRLGYFALVGIVGCAVLVLIPRRGVGVLTRCGRHSLQVYILHAFVYYALSNYHFAVNVYGALPRPVAFLALSAVSVGCALLLGYPDKIQAGFDSVRRWCGLLLVPVDKDGTMQTAAGMQKHGS